MNVSLRIPVCLSNFSTLDNGRTVAKLKVFYIGETADGRIFDEEFANKLKATLAGCPVVGYFSDIKNDFLGHNAVQYIYGFVTPDAAEKADFEEIDGQTWLVTEVQLYTDRHDNIGEVANKILGHPHSLEMDPKTAKYEVFREGGKTKIRFKEASLIGLSVLGETQQPAFTGSEFFSISNFGMDEMRERFENFFSYLENSRGGQMEKQQFEALANFVRLSYNDKMKMAETKLGEQLGDATICYVCEMDDLSFVAETYDFETGKHAFYKYDYSMDGEVDFAISNQREAFQKFVTMEDLQKLEDASLQASVQPAEEDDEKEEQMAVKKQPYGEPVSQEDLDQAGEENTAPTPADPEAAPSEGEDAGETGETGEAGEGDVTTAEKQSEEDEEDKKTDCATPEEEDKEATPEEEKTEDEKKKDSECEVKEDQKEQEEEDESNEEKENCSSKETALSDCERIELENYRRQEKLNLIESFRNMVSDEVIASFANNVDEYDKARLEAELALEFTRISRINKAAEQTAVVEQARNPFSMGVTAKSGELSYDELVAKQLAKKRK